MNQHKLTQTIQILLLVFFTLVLAVPALAQAPNPAPSETTSSPAKPNHTIHPASEIGFRYARLSNKLSTNCIANDYSVNRVNARTGR